MLRIGVYGSRESINTLAQRGSPDGASSRAESPPANGRINQAGSNYYETRIPPKFQKQPKMDQNYNQFTRQFVVDRQPPRLPTTSPPSYPGGSFNSDKTSGVFSMGDVSASSNLQLSSSRDNYKAER